MSVIAICPMRDKERKVNRISGIRTGGEARAIVSRFIVDEVEVAGVGERFQRTRTTGI